jgi:radical SAM protein with 4Fe4S-binding SPASM domain
MSFEGFPLVVGWEITLSCNLRCGHCGSSAGISRPDELSLEEALGICDQLPSLLVQEVDLTGGEPLLCANWPKIAGRLHELEIPVRLVTNGILLKDSAPLLLDVAINTVAVSLDGLEATHDIIRKRKGLFRQVVDGIEYALSIDIPVAVITAVNEMNVDELPPLLTFLRNLGVRYWQVQPTFSSGRAQDTKGLALSESSFLKLGRFVHDKAAVCGQRGYKIMPGDGLGYYSELDTRESPWRGCSAGRASCGITSDGKIKGCLSLPDSFIEGDLRKRDFWSIWFDDKSFAYNRYFSQKDLGDECLGCSHGEQCMGGCTIMSYASTQHLHNDPFCFYKLLGRGRQPCAPFDKNT